jgi:hypothetical protein
MSDKQVGKQNVERTSRVADHRSMSDDEHLAEKAKQQVAGTPHHEQQRIPKAGTNPALRALQERKQQAAARDDRVDQMSEDSFPASDPPSMP